MKNFKEIPDEETIKAAAALDIFDEKGNKIKFGSIFENQRTIIAFIRHFICGTCQSYVGALEKVPSDCLDAANTRIVVIGCGEYGPIGAYKEMTKFSGEVYADPTRNLYHALGMDIENKDPTAPGETPRSYVPSSSFMNAAGSIWRALQRPSIIGKSGDFAQLGGEFIFGPGNTCTFASRMRNTEDRRIGADTEVVDLMKEAGVIYQTS